MPEMESNLEIGKLTNSIRCFATDAPHGQMHLRTYRRVNAKTMQWDYHPELGKDDLIMINPFKAQEKDIMFSVATIDDWYKEVLRNYCSFSDSYTIYSLRSTHITYAILRGVREGKKWIKYQDHLR